MLKIFNIKKYPAHTYKYRYLSEYLEKKVIQLEVELEGKPLVLENDEKTELTNLRTDNAMLKKQNAALNKDKNQ